MMGFYAGTPEKSVTKAKGHLICMTLNKLRGLTVNDVKNHAKQYQKSILIRSSLK